jgi:hypothetical protein
MTLSITHLTFDCRDAAELAEFWSAALDRAVDDGASDAFAQIGGEPSLMFMRVPEGKAAKNRMHLDLTTDDLVLEVKRLVELGAIHIEDHEEEGARWAVMSDTGGNEFCVVAA